VIVGAPVLALGLLLVGAVIAWWLRGKNAEGEIAGLKAQLAARDDRMKFRDDKLADVQQHVETLKLRIKELEEAFRLESLSSVRTGPMPHIGPTGPAIKEVAEAADALGTSISAITFPSFQHAPVHGKTGSGL